MLKKKVLNSQMSNQKLFLEAIVVAAVTLATNVDPILQADLNMVQEDTKDGTMSDAINVATHGGQKFNKAQFIISAVKTHFFVCVLTINRPGRQRMLKDMK